MSHLTEGQINEVKGFFNYYHKQFHQSDSKAAPAFFLPETPDKGPECICEPKILDKKKYFDKYEYHDIDCPVRKWLQENPPEQEKPGGRGCYRNSKKTFG